MEGILTGKTSRQEYVFQGWIFQKNISSNQVLYFKRTEGSYYWYDSTETEFEKARVAGTEKGKQFPIIERYTFQDEIFSKEINYQNATKYYKKQPAVSYWEMSNELEFINAKSFGKEIKSW